MIATLRPGACVNEKEAGQFDIIRFHPYASFDNIFCFLVSTAWHRFFFFFFNDPGAIISGSHLVHVPLRFR